MRILENPAKEQWEALCQRPAFDNKKLTSKVEAIMSAVKDKGDAALKSFTKEFDGIELEGLRVSEREIKGAEQEVAGDLKAALDIAIHTITKFHKAQVLQSQKIETTRGVKCWQKQVPIDKVGLYVPGGSAPLFSTLLMLGIPATIAGCKEIRICTPPAKNGKVNPVILYLARQLGIDEVYALGGAQAIAALTYGTESIPKVNKIFGPGNQYVTKAKELAQLNGVAIDMPAGPSEVLVIADVSAEASFVAADLLSQAEHGPDSQVVLLSTSKKIAEAVEQELEKQLALLPRQEIGRKALTNSLSIVLNTLAACVEFSNEYAPEHLIINCQQAEQIAESITNAGSVFIGEYSCESAGDYASGTNHTLPTNGFAKNYSGVGLQSFCKTITFQELSDKGLKSIGPAVEIMAAAEGLDAHKNAVSIRLKKLQNV